MLTDSLIDDAVWADLPENNNEAFLSIVTAARARLETILSGDETGRGRHAEITWRRTFVHEVSAAADHLGVAGLLTPAQAEQSTEAMDNFNAILARKLTDIKLGLRAKLRTDSAALAPSTKETIRAALEDVRARINSSNLSDALKASLHRKVDGVEAELDKPRSAMGPLWILAGALAMAAPTAIGAAADLPQAVSTVQSAIALAHVDKLMEYQHEAHLTGRPMLTGEPQKLITDESVTVK